MDPHWLRYLPALLCLAASGPAAAAVEWFASPNPGEPQFGWSSHVGTWAQARATAGQLSESPCSFAVGNPPQPLTAWFKQFTHCREPAEFTRGESAFFNSHDSGFAEFSDPATGREARLTSVATQEAYFHSSYLRVIASVETHHTGVAGVGMLSRPHAWGEAYFRVPEGPKVKMSLNVSLEWEGSATARNGSLQVLWMANTLRDPAADRVNFVFRPQKGATSHAFDERTHWLSPGVYQITWHVHNSVTTAGNRDSKVNFTLKVGFGERERCPDTLGPASPTWPRGTTYTATVRAEPVGLFGEDVSGGSTRDAPQCEKGSTVCWKQEKVNVYITKDGIEQGPYQGWRYVPGTLTRDPAYPLRCEDIDPRFNCHGYSFAAGIAWLEQEAVQQILRDWCLPSIRRAPGEWHAGDIRVFRDPARTEWHVAPWLQDYMFPDHSGTLLETVGAVDEKLGLVVLQRPAHLSTLTRTEGVPEYYRCRF